MSSHSGSAAAEPVFAQRTFLGHPLGLYVLFFTEMWERFNYYGMRALLMLYMLNYFRWEQQQASTVYKLFTSFVYVTPIIGGYLADRFLGNRWAVIIGASLMAAGQILMTFEPEPIFMSALVLLIVGNGFFKPNMSTQVGRLYPANDGRRDGAYTIFYMGINLGAFIAPLICGWLAENTVGEYRSGFLAAGIGMILGLVIYLAGQPLVREIPRGTILAQPAAQKHVLAATALTEEQAEQAPSMLGTLAGVLPGALAVLGAVLAAAASLLWVLQRLDQWNSIMLGISGICLLLMAFVASKVRGGMRDRVTAILVLGVFVVFFWAAFEQAGNVLNVWADKNTNRYLTQPAQPPPLVPAVTEETEAAGSSPAAPRTVGLLEHFTSMFRLKPPPAGKPPQGWWEWLTGSLNPVPTAWFQSINALAIFLLAPVFAWLWIALDRRGCQPSIPLKMVFGMVLISASMAVMIGAAQQEDKKTDLALDEVSLPAGIMVNEAGQVGYRTEKDEEKLFQAGRLTFDSELRSLHLTGVLSDNDRDRIIEETAPQAFRHKVEVLQEAAKQIKVHETKPGSVSRVTVKLDSVPEGFDLKYAGLKSSKVQYQPADQTLTAFQPLADKDVKGLLKAAGEPRFREKMQELCVESQRFLVSPMWLFWSYILATLGELCLSPVGLSMVSKLAPARYATMLMGMWMLTTAFGNFAAGTLGEIWGTITPVSFFLLATAVVGGAALLLLVLVRMTRSMMHGVN
jgi:POT family proton-dependent oligopeptide transporter